jgi:hypothetical protein
MFPLRPGAPSTDCADIKQAWRDASMTEAWLLPADWDTPEIDAVARACLGDATPGALVEALESLGYARGHAGVGADEALRDVECLGEVAPMKVSPWKAARAVARGWSEATAQWGQLEAVRDAASDLATLPYLAVRLDEIYAECRACAREVTEYYCLVAVDIALPCEDPFLRIRRATALGGALRSVFSAGQTIACFRQPAAAALVLVARDSHLGPTLSALRGSLGTALDRMAQEGVARKPPRIWVESLPSDYHAAVELIGSLTR